MSNQPNNLLHLFYKIPIFKGIIQNNLKEEIDKRVNEQVIARLPLEIAKAQNPNGTAANGDAMRYRVPMNWNAQQNPDTKMFSNVSFTTLRQFALVYPIARACINRRKSQITQLQYDIAPVGEDVEISPTDKGIVEIKAFFKNPMGHKTRIRELMHIMVDDTLTVDGICFEFQRAFNGQLLNLIPVDPTTIVLQVTETGGVPTPPTDAYVQYINGKKIAGFNTDEMLYEAMNTRSYTPYGLAPLESLILQVESALRGALYNLNFFKEGNIPEGFMTLPEESASTVDEVNQWQEWFDAILAGNSRVLRRFKVLPHGSEYIPSKKAEDMAFERFELWLLEQTCAVFDVQPQDIGITLNVNRANGETQQQIGRERGLYPLANYLKEIFDDLIQVEMGYEDLQFIWVNIDPTNEKEEIEIAEKEIKIGARSVDEYRMSKGLKPIGMDHAVFLGGSVIKVKDLDKQFEQNQANARVNPIDPRVKDPKEEETEKMEQEEIHKWRTCIYNDLKEGKPLRKVFTTDKIRPEVLKEISQGLEGVTNRLQAKYLFDVYLDSRIKSAMELLDASSVLRAIEEA